VKKIFILILFLVLLISGCSVNEDKDYFGWINYNFNLPYEFPFEIDKQYVELETTGYYNQFVFHYINSNTSQEIKYIISIVNYESESHSFKEGLLITLDNGLEANYIEDDTSQSIWWDNGEFSMRYIYYINGNQDELDDKKLDIESFVELVYQVQ